MTAANRPLRPSVIDELGKIKTLCASPDDFACLGQGQEALFLGLGPDPGLAESISKEYATVRFIEHPDFEASMPDSWAGSIPDRFIRLDREKAGQAISGTVFLYEPNLKLFPSFYAPLWAAARLAAVKAAALPVAPNVLLLACSDGLLIGREIKEAFERLGFEVMAIDPHEIEHKLILVLKQLRPGLFLSVNFQGLDAQGINYHLLRQAGVKVATWLVDNPFHIISSLRSGYWRELALLVTDNWFVAELKRHGAQKVLHLPLGASPSFAARARLDTGIDLGGRVVFVGRSEFPDKQGFFAGQSLSQEERDLAKRKLIQGERPDFAWWTREYGLSELWPGNACRKAGYAAEETGNLWRRICLKNLNLLGRLSVFGDPGWRELLGSAADLRDPVDYYGPLAEIYAKAGYSLNLTSLLLPRGLTQRHFDVWSAGGFLISDATPGLEIFPAELTREISFTKPDELNLLVARLDNSPGLREDLRKAWRELIFKEHTYAARAVALLEFLEMQS